MIPIDVAQIPARLNDIPHAPLQLLGLGEPTIHLPIPQDGRGRGGGLRGESGGARRRGDAVVYGDDEGAARGGLEGDFADGEGEGGEELLSVLFFQPEKRCIGFVSPGLDDGSRISGTE